RVLRLPAARVIELTTAALLPPRLRARVGLHLRTRDRAELRLLGGASRRATPVMPAALRRTGPGYPQLRHEAIEREHGLQLAARLRAQDVDDAAGAADVLVRLAASYVLFPAPDLDARAFAERTLAPIVGRRCPGSSPSSAPR